MPGADLTAEPQQLRIRGGWSGWAGRLAALVAFGLGVLAAVMMVAGHAPWDGPQVFALSATHGVHQGDVLAIVPLVAGTGLAWWCLHRPSHAAIAAMEQASMEPRPPDGPDRHGGSSNPSYRPRR